MIRLARQSLHDRPNAYVFQNNGVDLSVLGDIQVDFAFSFIVFQHIPSLEVIRSYVQEVHRLLRPGGLFKFQVQGSKMEAGSEDTWVGVSAFTCFQTKPAAMAEACGFEARYLHGAGSEFFWLWYFRR